MFQDIQFKNNENKHITRCAMINLAFSPIFLKSNSTKIKTSLIKLQWIQSKMTMNWTMKIDEWRLQINNNLRLNSTKGDNILKEESSNYDSMIFENIETLIPEPDFVSITWFEPYVIYKMLYNHFNSPIPGNIKLPDSSKRLSRNVVDILTKCWKYDHNMS